MAAIIETNLVRRFEQLRRHVGRCFVCARAECGTLWLRFRIDWTFCPAGKRLERKAKALAKQAGWI